MENVHKIYFKYLNRTCELEVVRRILKNGIIPNLVKLENATKSSDEAHAVNMIRKALSNPEEISYVDKINDMYMTLLERLPTNHEVKKSLELLEQFGEPLAMSILNNFTQNTDDYRYLQECRSFLPIKEVPDNPLIGSYADATEVVRIKYCFPLGTSGIANISQEIIRGLAELPNVQLEIECIQFHNFDRNVAPDVCKLYSRALAKYDYVVVHNVPEFIPVVAKRERAKNPNVKIYAIVAWETDQLPAQWLPWLQYADKISCPSYFNAAAFQKQCSLLPPIDTVHHPIEVDGSVKVCALDPCPLMELKNRVEGAYVFYNISEWSNRKGITELIEVFVSTFGDDRTTFLYLKVFGDVDAETGRAYVNQFGAKGSNVILDYHRVSEEYIDCIHACGDCFVSMTKAEGHFIGVCKAHFAGKPVIVTGASGHMDYLSAEVGNCHFIPVTNEPAIFCADLGDKHKNCRFMPHCIYFANFVPCQMNWFHPNRDVTASLLQKIRYEVPNPINMDMMTAWKQRFSRRECAKRFLASLLDTRLYKKRTENLAKICKPAFAETYDWKTVDFKSNANGSNHNNHNLRSNVVLINAGFFGNVGDFLYTHIVQKFFRQKAAVNLTVISDTQCALDDGKIIPTRDFRAETHTLKKVDYVMVGGGGLLNKDRLSADNSIQFYSNHCKITKTPLYLFSVGFQDIYTNSDGSLRGYEWTHKYNDLLRTASYISARSLLDYGRILDILNYNDVSKVKFHPDLVYSLFKVDPSLRVPFKSKRDIVTVIYSENSTDFLNMTFPPHKQIYFMNFDGNIFEKRKTKRFLDMRAAIMERYPYSFFFHGMDIDPVTLDYVSTSTNVQVNTNLETFSLRFLIETLSNSKYLYTTRYHGYILGTLCEVPQIVLRDINNYKIRADILSNKGLDVATLADDAYVALKNIEVQIVEEIRFDYVNWDEDKRNTMIAKLASRKGYPVPLFQSMTNRQLQLADQTGCLSFLHNNENTLE